MRLQIEPSQHKRIRRTTMRLQLYSINFILCWASPAAHSSICGGCLTACRGIQVNMLP